MCDCGKMIHENSCSKEEAELDPNHVNAKDIAIVWVEE